MTLSKIVTIILSCLILFYLSLPVVRVQTLFPTLTLENNDRGLYIVKASTEHFYLLK